MAFKRGPLGKPEKKFVAENSSVLTAAEIAAKLNRSVEMVEAYMRNHADVVVPRDAPQNLAVRTSLRASEKWRRTISELTSEELLFFEEEYVKLLGQFDGDVYPSEETQIFDAIKFDILKGRNMTKRKRARENIEHLEQTQEDFLERFNNDVTQMSDDERAYALNLETQLTVARRAEQDYTNEYVKLQERQDGLMRSLKSTRDQRFKEVESNKVGILTLLKQLQRQDFARKEGRQAGLYKLAGEKEYNRLGQLHEYEDGTLDRPILSADTIDLVDDADVEPDGQQEDEDE